MSLDYVYSRVQDALRLSHGNAARARQQVIAWTYEDPKLLQALTRAHLSGIVAYHIDRVLSGRAAPKDAGPRARIPAAQPANKDERFGLEILKAVAADGVDQFGLEKTGVPRKRGKASQRHVDALRMMAAKSRNNS